MAIYNGGLNIIAPDISGKEDKSNKVTTWSSTTTDEHYPSEKLVKDALDGKANGVHNHDEYYYRKEKVTEMIQDPTANTPGVCVGYGQDILGGY